MIDKVTVHGTLSFFLVMICDSLKEGYDISNSPILSNAMTFLEDEGITLDLLKSLISKSAKRQFNREEMLEDVSVMSLEELAKKWQRSEQAIRDYCYRNKIEYKKRQKRIDLKALKEELISYDGAYTIDQIVKRTHHEYNFIKGFCDNNNIKYRRKVCISQR